MASSRFSALLFGVFLLVGMPVMAEEPAGNIPPQSQTTAQIPPGTPPEIMIEPQATEGVKISPARDGKSCIKKHMYVDLEKSLPAVYMTGTLAGHIDNPFLSRDVPDKFQVLIHDGGVLSMDKDTFTLKAIEIELGPVFPVSDIRYDISFNLIHFSVDGETILVSIPVKLGAPNIGADQILEATGQIDINNFLPDDRSIAFIEESEGDECIWPKHMRRYMLLMPIEISPVQFKKLSARC